MDYRELERLLVQKRISKRKLAEKVGMSWAGFHTMMKNETMSVAMLERIAHALKLTPCQLMEGVGMNQNAAPEKPDVAKGSDTPDQPELIKELQGIRKALEKISMAK